MITEDETFKCDFCGQSNTGEYYLVTGNHVLCQDYEQKIATLRAQLAEAVEIIKSMKSINAWSSVEIDYARQLAKEYLNKVTPA